MDSPETKLKSQVGGTHYKGFKIQPVDFIEDNNIGFAAGNVIKYVCRYPFKNGLEDLQKAKHYLEILINKVQAEELSAAIKADLEVEVGKGTTGIKFVDGLK